MAAFTASQASVTNGSKVVTINSGESIANIRQGDFLFLAGFLVEINRGYVGGSSQQYIELVKNWANSNQSSQPAVVIPTTGDFRAAVDAINNANKNVYDNFVAMQNWQTNMGTVAFTNQDGTTTTVKTLKQIEADNEAQMDAYHPYPWAMRKVEFEARRAENNEKFAASGFVHFGKHLTSAGGAINQGLWVLNSQGRNLVMGRGTSALGLSKKDYPVVNISGVLTNIEYMNSAVRDNYIQLPNVEDGRRTYDIATGVSAQHASISIAFASETATNKVVTDRVDMWGVEAFLREINDADPFVYKYGLIQSQATNINGVATASDNVRSITYFAWYEGDTTSRGKGVNWQTASEAQRMVIASDLENNIFFDDVTGKFYQWTLRGRSFAGAGNGDWSELFSMRGDGGYLKWDANSLVLPKGTLDYSPEYTKSAAIYLAHNQSTISNLKKGDFGLFKVRDFSHEGINYPEDVCSDGECYFLVFGTVNRLNKGAYHKQLNPFGANRFVRQSSPEVGGDTWSVTGYPYESVFDCFETEENGGARANKDFGIVYNGASGRPDGRYYDVIYTSGQGGVCRDMRYSAWCLTQEDFAEADLAIKAGNYRGTEQVPVIKAGTVTTIGSVFNDGVTKLIVSGQRFSDDFEGWQGYTKSSPTIHVGVPGCFIVDSEGNLQKIKLVTIRTNSDSTCYVVGNVTSKFPNGTYTVIISRDDLGSKYPFMAHEFNYTEVQGPLSEIILCDDLRDGWIGGYLPDLPDGTKDEFQLTRPYTGTGTDITRTHTLDRGATWTYAATAIGNAAKNTVNVTDMPANQVTIWQYKTKANMTKSTVNSATRNINNVIVSDSATQARDLGFSLTDNVNTSTINQAVELGLNQLGIELATGRLSASKETKHVTIPLVTPTNNSRAFKALNYNVVENQQGFINYAYTELTHNGTDWGDDGKIHIVDNQTTMLDENGNTNLVGTSQCVEPLGWIKNDK
ncbi:MULTISPECIES: hypothetical protein [Pseudoalteromonas]|uniref:hypothetical protein n=1 Tax=Pseudoalteromonas TaxID=53246 RepID=UPI0002E50BC4|nr:MULTISPECIES: hypothetical protein [Pseudoalteromonas]MCF6142928.1 hypothetical protein [Pseudoalteromonas mariniglutinosa NCIMB 1770]